MLRNREFRRFAVLFALMSAAAVTAGLAVSPAAAVLAAAIAVAFGAAFFVFTRNRYKRIARLSGQIDLVLHNADHLYFEEAEEGELSILSSEISKMTLRIREQNQALRREKSNLAGSLADIAHQLRTPLTSAGLILPLLADNPEEGERKALAREAQELFVRMDWLLTSLLKISRLDAGIVEFQRRRIAVDELIRAALRPLLIPMELHGIRLQVKVPEGVELWGDFGWLSEAVENILKNCLESAGDNGRIEIACADNPLFTELTIRDSGAGFEPEDLPRLFDRFYRGKTAGASGYGIGLALCRMIIAGQGGSVTAGNHPKGGAVFSIRFPK